MHIIAFRPSLDQASTATKMSYLEVPGASLYYETVGEGPLLLCISGASGSVDRWRSMANELKGSFTVAMYDRRGFSRSYLSGAQNYAHRIETDADDARHLIQHLSKEPATVIGNSSGAIVALELVYRHPEVVRTLIPHEPPAIKLLPDHDELWQMQNDIYQTYRASGVSPAMEKVADMIKAGVEREPLLKGFDARAGPFVAQNVMYWFEREVLTYPFRDFDLKILQERRPILLLANGGSSNHEALQYRANLVLGEKLGIEVTDLPGLHLGFASHPKEFAQELLIALKKKDDFYATR